MALLPLSFNMSEQQPEVKTEPEKDSAATQKQPEISDADIIAYEQQVKEEEALTRPLVGPLEPLQDLRAEYEHGSPVFLDKINARHFIPLLIRSIYQSNMIGFVVVAATAIAFSAPLRTAILNSCATGESTLP
jgi:hypothetical protein